MRKIRSFLIVYNIGIVKHIILMYFKYIIEVMLKYILKEHIINWRTYYFLEYLDEMKEYGPIHILWSASEEDLAETLKSVASCIDKCCKATEKRMSGFSEALLPVVHEYVLYSEMLMVRTPNYTSTWVPDLLLSFIKAVSVSVCSPLSSSRRKMLCM